jgi:hypothetical protein
VRWIPKIMFNMRKFRLWKYQMEMVFEANLLLIMTNNFCNLEMGKDHEEKEH